MRRDIKPEDDPPCAACGEGVACQESCCAVRESERIWHDVCAPEHLVTSGLAERLRTTRARSGGR